jgi:hypothetical protein
MRAGDKRTRIVPSSNVTEFFRDSVGEAVTRQQLEADDHTVHYVVNLLTLYTRSEELYDQSPEGQELPPLARMLADAMAAPTDRDCNRSLRRLGDTALFMAGFFPDSLARKPVDVDYYIRMGGTAYGALADRSRSAAQGKALAGVFAELERKFAAFVEVIGEISDLARHYTSRDILRLYERWLATGSPRVRNKLDELGVNLSLATASRRSH